MARIDYKAACSAIATNNVVDLKSELKKNPVVGSHWKPITDAAFFGRTECIEVLLNVGSDPNVTSGNSV